MGSCLQSDFERNAAFHDQTAAEYDGQLNRSPHDVLARIAFRDLVSRHVAGGSTVLDFGCGTGLDAFEYAQRGYRVLAYDNSPGMMDQLRRRCKSQIESGSVTPYSMPYPSFLESFPQWPAPNAVTADFAVLNSIRDLEPLFEALGRRLAAPGWVIASILNPLHWSKVKTRAWWRGALRAPRGPRIHTTQPYVSYLHFVPALLRAARGFHLIGRANAGALVRYDAVQVPSTRAWWNSTDSTLRGFTRLLWHSPAHKLLGHFIFLVLRRDP